MSGTFNVVMGDRGRLVLPAELRQRLNLESGTPLILIDTADGMVLTTRDQAKRIVRSSLAGQASLVDELIADRREAAARENEEFVG